MLLIISFNLQAYDEGTGDEVPESDVGLSSEANPLQDLKIREVKFTLAKGKPVIDGNLDDKFWRQAEKFKLEYELYPIRLAQAPVKTEAMVVATLDHLYVAFIAHDPDIKKLRSAPREHDGTKEDDYVSIILDPSGQMAKKYEFRVNPHGALSDVLQDRISDRYIYDWDTEWNGDAQITKTGYTVEIAIPVDSIRQPEVVEGETAKGVVVLKRSYPRRVDRTLGTFFVVSRKGDEETKKKKENIDALTDSVIAEKVSVKAPILKDADKSQITEALAEEDDKEKVSKVQEKISTDLQHKNFQITPYYIYHPDEERDIGGVYEQVDDFGKNDVGFDAKIQFDSARSLAISVNPNFTEVESDIARQSINNSFIVFKPEKRPIFKDATEYYSTLLPIVYTRNIIQPKLGVSYLKTGTNNSSGIFVVGDEKTEVIMPDTFGSDAVELDEESVSAALRYQYSKDKKTTGLLATFRTGQDGYHNAVAGIDGLIDLGVDDKIRYQLMYSNTLYPQSFAEDLCENDGCTLPPPPASPCTIGNCDTNAQVLRTNHGETLNDHGLRLSYKHDGPKSLYWVNYFDVAPDFRADLGFARKVDIRALNVAYGKNWYVKTTDDDAGKSRIRVYAIGNHHRSYENNDEIETGITLLSEFRGTHQTVFRVARRFRDIAVNRIDQSSLETGDNAPLFSEDYWFWYYQIAPSVKWTFDLNGKIGKVADADNMVLGDMTEYKPKIKYRLDNFEVSAEAVFRDFEVDNERLYNEKFLTFGVVYRRNKQMSHRILYLDDITRQETSRAEWLDKSENYRELEQSVEYTFTYKKNKLWKVLTGVKLGYEQENNSVKDQTNRELYIKIQRRFDAEI